MKKCLFFILLFFYSYIIFSQSCDIAVTPSYGTGAIGYFKNINAQLNSNGYVSTGGNTNSTLNSECTFSYSLINSMFTNPGYIINSLSIFELEIWTESLSWKTKTCLSQGTVPGSTTWIATLGSSHFPSLEYGTTHYWRINLINGTDTIRTCDPRAFTTVFAPPLLVEHNNSTACQECQINSKTPSFQVKYDKAVKEFNIQIATDYNFLNVIHTQKFNAGYAANANPVLTCSQINALSECTKYYVRVNALPDYTNIPVSSAAENANQITKVTDWSWSTFGAHYTGNSELHGRFYYPTYANANKDFPLPYRTDQTYWFTYADPMSTFVAVTDITGVPATMQPSASVNLSSAATVSPSNATNQTIVWSMYDAGTTGASVSSGGALSASNEGTLIVKATITNGVECVDYVKYFEIVVQEPQEPGDCTPKHKMQTAYIGDDLQQGETFSSIPYTNPLTQKVVAKWEQEVHCGRLTVNVKDNQNEVGSTTKENNNGGESGDCGYWFEMDLHDVPYPNPTLSFEIYLENGSCGGQGIAANGGKTRAKGEITSPIVYNYTIDVVSTLPVALIDFNADCRNNQVLLKWISATETNNAYFTLERGESAGAAIRWTALANIKGAGNSSTPNSYSYAYTDYSANTGENVYYRLKQTDYNGAYEYFSTVVATCQAREGEIRVYPNPTTGQLTINNEQLTIGDVQIFDVMGRKQKAESKNADGVITLDISHLPKGIYFLHVNGTVFKVVKE